MAQSQPEIYRNSDGTFAKGSIPNPKGRPKREVEQQYLDVTIATVSPEDWATVVQSMVSRAKAGDVQAARWLGDYVLGKPTEHIAISQDDSLKIALHLPQMASDNGSEPPQIEAGSGHATDKTLYRNEPLTPANGSTTTSGNNSQHEGTD